MKCNVLALIAIWMPETENMSYGCTLPGFPGTNSAGESVQECVANIQEAFDLMNEDIKVTQKHIDDLIDQRHMLDHEDDILIDCVWQVIVIEAECEDDVVLSGEYMSRVATLNQYRKA